MILSRANVLFAVMIGLAACASKPVDDRYYSLVLAADNVPAPANAEDANAHLIVGPIQLPAYLNNRGLAIQLGSNQIQTANHHFWAEPLEEAISKVLVRDISSRIDGMAVDRDAGRWTVAGDCRLRVEFDKFHATSESRVVSSGRYWISSTGLSVKKEFDMVRVLSADGYTHAVEALRELLGTLAMQITDTIGNNASCSGDSTKVENQG